MRGYGKKVRKKGKTYSGSGSTRTDPTGRRAGEPRAFHMLLQRMFRGEVVASTKTG